jgi:xanthosine utilization system XapX-like protein
MTGRRDVAILGDPVEFERRLADDPRRWALALAAAEGLVGVLSFATAPESSPDRYGALIAIPIIVVALGPLIGVVGLYVNWQLLCWAGRILGGNARPEAVRAAQAWAGLPVLFGMLVLLPRAFSTWRGFTAASPGSFDLFLSDLLKAARTPADLFLQALALICIWRLSQFVGAAQGFSSRRAFVSEVLATALGVTALVLVGAAGWAAYRLVG